MLVLKSIRSFEMVKTRILRAYKEQGDFVKVVDYDLNDITGDVASEIVKQADRVEYFNDLVEKH